MRLVSGFGLSLALLGWIAGCGDSTSTGGGSRGGAGATQAGNTGSAARAGNGGRGGAAGASAAPGGGSSAGGASGAGAGSSGTHGSDAGRGGRFALGGRGGAAPEDGGAGGADAGAAGALAGSSGKGSATGGGSVGGGSPGGQSGAAGDSGDAGNGGEGPGPDFDFTTEPDQAVAYQIDPAHSGAQLGTIITPPLASIWSLKFGAGISYPLVVGSRIFISIDPSGYTTGPFVRALDAATGSTLWSSDVINGDPIIWTAVHLAYDRGLVFAMNEHGLVYAFDPATGAVRWHEQLKDVYGFGTMPVAAGGALFLTGVTGTMTNLFVLDERNGHTIYTGYAQGAGHPTLGTGLLFSTGGCHETEGMIASSGKVLWHYMEDCTGGGGQRTVFHNGLLWAQESGMPEIALDAATGTLKGTLDEPNTFWQVSASNNTVVLPSVYKGNNLKLYDAADQTPLGAVPLPAFTVLPALVTPGYAFVVCGEQWQDKYLYGVKLASKELVWQSDEPAAPLDSSWTPTGGEPFQAMAASEGRIIVAYGRSLSAYAAPD